MFDLDRYHPSVSGERARAVKGLGRRFFLTPYDPQAASRVQFDVFLSETGCCEGSCGLQDLRVKQLPDKMLEVF